MNKMFEITKLSSSLSSTFIDLAEIVWSVRRADPELFKQIWTTTPLGQRRTYALARIGRLLEEHDLDRKRLSRLGWSKTELIAGKMTAKNMNALLVLAESHNARDLRRVLRGEKALRPKLLVFELTPMQYDAVTKTLLAHGAKRKPGGLVNKERALYQAVASLELLQYLAKNKT
jgi:hypothetical protein